MKNTLSGLFTIAVIGFVIYNNIPRYQIFDSGVMSMGAHEYYFYEIENSESSANLKIQLGDLNSTDPKFDAYLMTGDNYDRLDAWMKTDEEYDPEVSYMHMWEDVSFVLQEEITIPNGRSVIIIDNSTFGSHPGSENPLNIKFALSEKY